MRLTNYNQLSLPMAVWLAEDTYDYHGGRKAISATSLLKAPRQIILRERLTEQDALTPDVSDFLAARLGTAIHDGIEAAWRRNAWNGLRKLGYPDEMVERVLVNPAPEDLTRMKAEGRDPIPVYFEKRTDRELMGYTITGKFDMVVDGELQDFKSTSVWSYILGGKDEDYKFQGSVYRWLNPDLITADHMHIQFIFTDWQRAMVGTRENYPETRVIQHRIELYSSQEIEQILRNKIRSLEAIADLPEEELPHCTDEELWRSAATYKYFADPAKIDGRATRRFDTLAEANAFMNQKGKGIVITIPGQAKACGYCPAFPICTQKDLYDHG